jgi:Glycosyltransferase like family 2
MAQHQGSGLARAEYRAYPHGGLAAASAPLDLPRPATVDNVIDLFPALRRACPELDCVRGQLPAEVIASAERRAGELDIGADRVLVSAGTMTEEDYLGALAAFLGIAFAPLDELPRYACPLADERLVEAAAVGLLPLTLDGEFVWVVAPRNLAARTLTRLLALHPTLAPRIRLAPTASLNRFIARHAGQALGAKATDALRRRWPELSAAPRRWRASLGVLIAATLCPAVLVAFPMPAIAAIEAMLAAGFLAWLALRLFGSLIEPVPARPVGLSDRELPVYSIIVALYRETEAVSALVASLRKPAYPPEKLDIKLVIEIDDLETGIALSRLDLGPSFELIVAPPVGPRTKPKALNIALPYARGTFTAIYDAEDQPEPDQLRRALDVFLSRGDELACVQARLTIDNTGDNWLARIFTAEYAAQFDLFLPGLAARTATAARWHVEPFPRPYVAKAGRRRPTLLGPIFACLEGAHLTSNGTRNNEKLRMRQIRVMGQPDSEPTAMPEVTETLRQLTLQVMLISAGVFGIVGGFVSATEKKFKRKRVLAWALSACPGTY